MRSRRLILATALATACTAAATGALAWPGGQMPSPEQRAAHMQKALQLNDEQRPQVQKIIEKSAQQRSALEKKFTIAERDQFRAESRKLYETQHAEIEALLTPAQREAMAAQRQQMGHSRKMGRHMGDCPQAGANAKK